MENDSENQIEDNDEQSFAELLESYSQKMNDDIHVGDKIKGKIIAIGDDSIFVDTGTKVDGVVAKNELVDEEGLLTLQKGDFLDLYVVAMDEGEIRLSKAISGIESSHLLFDAFNNKIPVEGKVTALCKGGFHVDIMKKRAFCPISHMDIRYVNNPDEYVGMIYQFLIKLYEGNGRNIVVSRRDFLEKDLEKAREEFFSNLEPGVTIEGIVTKIMPFGAFLELFPGIEGMVHISELAWSRPETVEEVVAPDDKIMVKVLSVEEKKDSKRPKIALSLKQVTENPWASVQKKFSPGERVKGKVKRCTSFGAFVEIASGCEGLVHISEMSYVKRVLNAEDIVQPGEEVWVVIKDVDQDNHRISLSIKDAEGDPWADVKEKYNPGQIIDAVIQKKERYGYFINLEPGITGLMPISTIKESMDQSSLEKLKPGDRIKVLIESINSMDRRISLAPADKAQSDEWKNFSDKTDSSLGSLGEKLRQAMDKKDK